MSPTPSRLLLSGGGHRATVGSLGAVAYLVHSRRWHDITEVVSVSGGSIANASLAIASAAADPWQVLADVVQRIDRDRGRVWATPRRTAMTIFAATVLIGVGAVIAVAFGLGPGVPAPVSVLVGLLAIPVVFRIGGRTASALTLDFIREVSGDTDAVLHTDPTRQRTHVFCASGLSSATPYTLWTGRPLDEDNVTWGAKVQTPYTVVEAALASVSLPFLGRVRSPRDPHNPDLLDGGEILVDGGVSGIFGDQRSTAFRRTPADTQRSDVGVLAIDGGRHTMSPNPLARRLSRNSVTATLFQWLKASLEATYVNDLVDLQPERLVRLCESDRPIETPQPPLSAVPAGLALRLGVVASPQPDPETTRRLDTLRARVATISLMNLNSARIDDALVAGFVGTMLAFEPAADASTIGHALTSAEKQLRRGARLSSLWAAAA